MAIALVHPAGSSSCHVSCSRSNDVGLTLPRVWVVLRQVDDSGKVQRMRKVCPEPQCDNCFMAAHKDRVYWYAGRARAPIVVVQCTLCALDALLDSLYVHTLSGT